MDDAVNTRAWLIGGAGRSGKTTLSDALRAHSRTIAGFPLEGVFHVYLQRRFPFFRHQRRRVLTEYMNRPRYMDAARTRVERPRDHLRIDVDELAQGIPDDITDPIGLFAWMLDEYAAEQGKSAWAIFDLLPELRFTTYRRLVPGAKLVVMQRAPEEAVAEALFWRTYPDAPEDRRRRFKNILFQWCLSKQVTDIHRRAFPDAVAVFSFNALVGGDEEEIGRVADTFAIDRNTVRQAFDFAPPFSYRSGLGFTGPDGETHQLLSEAELAEVHAAAAGQFANADLALLLRLAVRAPVTARWLGDVRLYPGMMLRRRINTLRQRAVDALAGLRLFLGTAS